MSLLPPQPARSILELTHPPPRFGEIMTAPFELHVSEKAARAPTKLADDELSEEEIDRPLNLNSSIFALRKRVSDGHSYYTPPSLVNRHFTSTGADATLRAFADCGTGGRWRSRYD